MPKPRFYEQGYSYLLRDPELKEWDYTYHKHKNQNGTHFDLRLYCPGGSENVYSWSSKKHLLDKILPVPIRRTKDHDIRWLTFEGIYHSPKKHKNELTIIENGSATLVNLVRDGFIFSTLERVFKIKHVKGKQYMFINLEGLVK